MLKYYVLIQDAYDADDSKAQEIFTQMQNAFGSSLCHILQINSGSNKEDSALPSKSMADFWFGPTHRFLNVETRQQGIGATVSTTTTTAKANSTVASDVPSASTKATSDHKMDHPLAGNPLMDGVEKDGGRSPTPPLVNTGAPKLQPASASNIAACLTSNDVDRIRILVRE